MSSMDLDNQEPEEYNVELSREDLVSLYRETHNDFFAAQPTTSSTRNVSRSTSSFAVAASWYDPHATFSVEKHYLGGGPSATKCRTMKEMQGPSLISDCPSASTWTTTKVFTASETSRVEPEASYTFVRELKRSVATDDKTVLHHLPVFEEPIRTHKFDRETYEDDFSYLEYYLPLDRPRVNTILYEFLRRVHHLHPSFSFDNNPSILNFLPHDVPEILLLPSSYELLPFPNPNPSTELGLYGDPTISLPTGKWLRAGKEGETWTEVLQASEAMLCPMASCNEFDCEIHSAVLERDEGVEPRARGLPTPTATLLAAATSPESCSPLCFVKEENKALAQELVNPTETSWPNEHLDLLMTLITAAPDILPCDLINAFISDDGEQLYSCREIFHRRCSVIDFTPARSSSALPKAKTHNKPAGSGPFALTASRMKTTRPCNHRGPCESGNTACVCLNNMVHCEKACGCDITCKRRFGVHLKTPRGGCNCAEKGTPCRTKSCECVKDARECDPNICLSCGSNAKNGSCWNVSLQRGLGKKTVVKPTKHGNGLFLAQDESADEDDFIIEYVGELVSHEEAATRGMIYEQIHRNYLFDLNASLAVDAFSKGNVARFINHPDNKDDANCHPKVLHILGEHRIGIYAGKPISGGEEILFDYGTEFKLPSQKSFSSGGPSTQGLRRGGTYAAQKSIPTRMSPEL